MSQLAPPFLAVLEIEDAPDLDERSLRRAYARRLKTIDVEAEPERFQALREALDQSLRWLAWRDRARLAAAAPPPASDPLDSIEAEKASPAASEPITTTQAAVSTPAAPARPSSEEIAALVFAHFEQQAAAGFDDEAPVRAALSLAVADERLVNLDTRAFFEWNVARMLAKGWRRGHEHVIAPAIEIFGWNSDHARLAHFGQVGALLSAAMRERSVFDSLTEPQRTALIPMLARIRNATPADPKLLHEEVPALQFLVQRAPNWLRIVSPVDPVNERFEMWRRMQASAPQSAKIAPSLGPQPEFVRRKPASATGPGTLVMIGVLILIVFSNLARLSSGGPSIASTRTTPTQPDPASDAELSRRQMQAEAILARITDKRTAKQSRGAPPVNQGTLPSPTITPLPSSLDQPWWAPSWSKPPDGTSTLESPPHG